MRVSFRRLKLTPLLVNARVRPLRANESSEFAASNNPAVYKNPSQSRFWSYRGRWKFLNAFKQLSSTVIRRFERKFALLVMSRAIIPLPSLLEKNHFYWYFTVLHSSLYRSVTFFFIILLLFHSTSTPWMILKSLNKQKSEKYFDYPWEIAFATF